MADTKKIEDKVERKEGKARSTQEGGPEGPTHRGTRRKQAEGQEDGTRRQQAVAEFLHFSSNAQMLRPVVQYARQAGLSSESGDQGAWVWLVNFLPENP